MSGRSRRPGEWAVAVHAPDAPGKAAVLAVEVLVLLNLVGRVLGAASNPARARALRLVEHQLSHVAQGVLALGGYLAAQASRPSGAGTGERAAPGTAARRNGAVPGSGGGVSGHE